MIITKHLLPKGEYIDQVTVKKSIVFHHTASGCTPQKEIDIWAHDPQGAVGTHYVIGRDGSIVQAIDESNWAYALGITNPLRTQIEAQSIQIELIAYGYLRKAQDGHWITAYGNTLPDTDVYELPQGFKGFKGFHRYTMEQIDSLMWLVPDICSRHNIKGSLSMKDFETSGTALGGGGGFWTHNSFRADKTDIYPDTRILSMFKKGWGKWSS